MPQNIVFSLITLLWCIFFGTVHCGDGNLKCLVQTPCSCQLDDHSEINLTGLFPTASKDKFLSDTQGNFTYFFSGCKDQDFKPQEHGLNSTIILRGSLIKCVENITEIQKNITIPGKNNTENIIVNILEIRHNCTVLGTEKQIDYDKATDDSNALQIVYNDEHNNKSSLASIRLVCDNFDHSDLKITNINSDVLALYSPTVCIKHTGSSGLSNGSVFLLTFFIGLGIYLVGGGLIMYTVRGARGVEVIPNLDFWKSIPGLVRDGIIYIFSGCRPVAISSAETYDRI